MTNLIPQDNFFQSLFDFRRDFDQIFHRMWGGTPFGEGHPSAVPVAVAPAVESFIDKSGKTFHYRMAIPGIDPGDVHIHAQGRTLTVQGGESSAQPQRTLNSSIVKFCTESSSGCGCFPRVSMWIS
jgi:HSP20 family molecular chaperone IbpA